MAPARREIEAAEQHHLAVSAAYSPELNPMENVWDYLRGNKLSHLVWNSYEAMLAACAEA